VTAPVVVRGIGKSFGGVRAVDDVDLVVEAGEIVGLLGANGAGKTTLMRMIMGLLRPDRGELRVFGGPPSRAARRRIGYVPQGLGLYTDLTVAENLRFARRAYGVGDGDVADAELVAANGLLVGELPLGLRRRAAFELVLQHRPGLLVLDEPTSGVDPLNRAVLWDRIRDAGAGALVSTHFTEEAQNCDRLVMMHEGRVAAVGTLAEIVGGRTAVNVTTDSWADAFTALDDAGLNVSLHGRDLRVTGSDTTAVAAALELIGGTLSEVPASFDEVFVELCRRR
jgi:ABC-2 type transport system ATP-binding protein/ribosome-dependent ATPase